MRTLFTAARALVVAAGFLYLWRWAAWRVHTLDGAWGLTLPAWTAAPGTALMALGGLLALACVGTFAVRGHGTPAPFDPPRQFVAAGPYRWVRNPMYIGALLLLAGYGLYLHSGAVLLFSGVWLGLAHLFVVVYEEPALRRRFGAAYENYCATVRRWLPSRPAGRPER